jgi:E3 ubiquitin-protein ligase HUWE1
VLAISKASGLLDVTPSGAVDIYVNAQTLESKDTITILTEAIEGHAIWMMTSASSSVAIRSAKVLVKGGDSNSEKLVLIRLLVIAFSVARISSTNRISSCIMTLLSSSKPIAPFQSQYRLLPPPSWISMARYRGNIQDVSTAVNAGVNHNISMALVRLIMSDIGKPDSTQLNAFQLFVAA